MCKGLGTFFESNILKADRTSFDEDLNWLDVLSLMCLIKVFPTLSDTYLLLLLTLLLHLVEVEPNLLKPSLTTNSTGTTLETTEI